MLLIGVFRILRLIAALNLHRQMVNGLQDHTPLFPTSIAPVPQPIDTDPGSKQV